MQKSRRICTIHRIIWKPSSTALHRFIYLHLRKCSWFRHNYNFLCQFIFHYGVKQNSLTFPGKTKLCLRQLLLAVMQFDPDVSFRLKLNIEKTPYIKRAFACQQLWCSNFRPTRCYWICNFLSYEAYFIRYWLMLKRINFNGSFFFYCRKQILALVSFLF